MAETHREQPISTGSLRLDMTAEANHRLGWLEGSFFIPEDWPGIFSVVLGEQIWWLRRGPGLLAISPVGASAVCG